MSVLGSALTAPSIPGSNLRGAVGGANWCFLLPSLELGRVAYVGAPSCAALITLTALSDEVVVCAPQRRLGRVRRAIRDKGLRGVSLLETEGRGAIPLSDRSADVVVLARHPDRRMGEEIERLLTPEGISFVEFRIPTRPSPRTSPLPLGRLERREVFWLAPAGGEVWAAAPVGDRRAIAYLEQRFLRRRLVLRRLLRHPRRALQRQLLVTRLARRRGALVVRSTATAVDGPPRYLQSVAAAAGISLERHRWGLAAPGDYGSQKVLFFLFRGDRGVPEYVAKITRDPSLNPRLENEHRALGLLGETEIGAASALPRPVFFGYRYGLAVLGETAIDGMPFVERTTSTADCGLAQAALDWLVELGVGTTWRPAGPAGAVAGELEALFERFRKIYQLSPAQDAFLAAQIEVLGSIEKGFPLVFQHGDPGPWNLLITAAGEPAFLDWEAAEPHGMPLWDLFHFLRSYSLRVSRASGTRDPMRSFEEQLLGDSELGRLLAQKTSRYCAETGLATELVEPLFYLCWVHRALREATRLHPHHLDRGRYVNLLRVSIERRESPGLRRLFSLPPGD
jgi:hypothetical protein